MQSRVIMQLNWSDIWVLQSLRGSAGDHELDICSVIAIADAINHAVLTSEEFNNAIFRLEEAGLIVVSGKSVVLSSNALELFQKYEKQSVRKQAETLQKKLGAISYSAEYNPNILVVPKEFISKGRFNNAVHQYQRKYSI
jgi:hypothetical protein